MILIIFKCTALSTFPLLYNQSPELTCLKNGSATPVPSPSTLATTLLLLVPMNLISLRASYLCAHSAFVFW